MKNVSAKLVQRGPCDKYFVSWVMSYPPVIILDVKIYGEKYASEYRTPRKDNPQVSYFRVGEA